MDDLEERDLFEIIDGELYFTVRWIHYALDIPRGETGSGKGREHIKSFLAADKEKYGAQMPRGRWLIHYKKLHLIVKKARESWDKERLKKT